MNLFSAKNKPRSNISGTAFDRGLMVYQLTVECLLQTTFIVILAPSIILDRAKLYTENSAMARLQDILRIWGPADPKYTQELLVVPRRSESLLFLCLYSLTYLSKTITASIMNPRNIYSYLTKEAPCQAEKLLTKLLIDVACQQKALPRTNYDSNNLACPLYNQLDLPRINRVLIKNHFLTLYHDTFQILLF